MMSYWRCNLTEKQVRITIDRPYLASHNNFDGQCESRAEGIHKATITWKDCANRTLCSFLVACL